MSRYTRERKVDHMQKAEEAGRQAGKKHFSHSLVHMHTCTYVEKVPSPSSSPLLLFATLNKAPLC